MRGVFRRAGSAMATEFGRCAADKLSYVGMNAEPFRRRTSPWSDGVRRAALNRSARLSHHILFLLVKKAGADLERGPAGYSRPGMKKPIDDSRRIGGKMEKVV